MSISVRTFGSLLRMATNGSMKVSAYGSCPGLAKASKASLQVRPNRGGIRWVRSCAAVGGGDGGAGGSGGSGGNGGGGGNSGSGWHGMLWAAYLSQLDKNPVVTKSVTSGVLNGAC